jgi:hypothetical protein
MIPINLAIIGAGVQPWRVADSRFMPRRRRDGVRMASSALP